jgi:predicted DNA-binding mobile mystery protein A
MTQRTVTANRRRARRRIDERTEAVRTNRDAFTVPHGGWISAIRESIGMSRSDLARRMGVAHSTISRLEAGERNGTVQLDTLRRVAAELECELVYALVPRRPLDDVVLDQARKRAAADLVVVEHSMLLESQLPAESTRRRMLDDDAGELIDRPGLWRD